MIGQILPDGSQTCLVQGTFYSWTLQSAINYVPRFGPGTGGFQDYRYIRDDTNFAWSGVTTYAGDGKPIPANYQGQKGFIELQYGINEVMLANGSSLADASYTITRPIIIRTYKLDDNETGKPSPLGPGLWASSGTAEATGPAVFSAAWGTMPDAGSVTKTDVVNYNTMAITLDTANNGLVGDQKYIIDYWTLTDDSDAGRKSKLLQAMQAAIPVDPRFKQRPATILPDSPSGGKIHIEFALKDTYDDVNLPVDIKNTDPDGLTNNYTWSAINGTPADPGVLNTQVIGQEVRILVDGKLQFINKGGGFTPRQAIEEGGTNYRFDVNSLENEGVSYVTYTTASGVPNSPAAPNGLQIVGTSSIATSHFKSKLKTDYGVRSPAQQLTFPETEDTTDPNNIAMTARRAQVYDIGSPPAVPTDLPTGNVKELRFVDIPKTPTLGETVGKMIRIWYYGGKDSKDELLLEHYRTTSDTNALQSSAVRAALDGDTNPTTVADSFGHTLVQRPSTVIPVTLGLGTNRVLTITEYGLRTTKEDITDEESEVAEDLSLVDSVETITEVYATGATPGNPSFTLPEVKLVEQRVKILNQIESKRTSVHKTKNPLDERDFDLTKTQVDGNSIEDESVRVKFWATNVSTPTSPVSPPSNNVKLRYHFTRNITPATMSVPGINMEVFIYGARDSKDSLILERYETTTDESALESSAIRSFLDGDSIPVTITDANGVTLYKTKTHVKPVTLALGTNRTLYVVEYATTTTAERITFPGSPIKSDFAEGFVQEFTTLEVSDPSVSIGDARIAYENANKNDKTYAGLTVEQFDHKYKLLKRRFIQDSKKVVSSGGSRSEFLNNIGNQVYIPFVIPRASNGTKAYIQKQQIWRSIAEMQVFRRFVITTDPTDAMLRSSQWNNRNISNFGPFNAGFVLFSYANFIYAGGQTMNRPVAIRYVLKIDSLFFQPTLPGGWIPSPTIGLTAGYHAWSDLGVGPYPNPPTSSDLSFIFA